MRPAGLPSSSKGQEAGARGQGQQAPAGPIPGWSASATSGAQAKGMSPPARRPPGPCAAGGQLGVAGGAAGESCSSRKLAGFSVHCLAPRAGPRAGTTCGPVRGCGLGCPLLRLLLGHCFLNPSWTPTVGTLVLSFAFFLARSPARSILLPTAEAQAVVIQGPRCPLADTPGHTVGPGGGGFLLISQLLESPLP